MNKNKAVTVEALLKQRELIESLEPDDREDEETYEVEFRRWAAEIQNYKDMVLKYEAQKARKREFASRDHASE